MSKELNKQDVILHIESSLNKLKIILNDLAQSGSNKDLKRSSLLAYWIDTYSDYIKDEDYFDPKHLIKYQRGNVIQVNFGYRVGNELGGLHYAIVLDKNNSKQSGIITVIPLVSLKTSFKENFHKIKLETGLFDLANEKVNTTLNQTVCRTIEIGDEYKKLLLNPDANEEELEKLSNKINNTLKQTKRIEIWKKEVERLKHGSIADTGQIITISKQKIVNPTKTSDLLYGMKITSEDMKKIDKKIKMNIL